MARIPLDKLEMLEYYNKGLELYKNQQFNEAIEEFKKALEILPDDEPSKMYIRRSEEYIKNPPPENWDKVYTMTSK